MSLTVENGNIVPNITNHKVDARASTGSQGVLTVSERVIDL